MEGGEELGVVVEDGSELEEVMVVEVDSGLAGGGKGLDVDEVEKRAASP